MSVGWLVCWSVGHANVWNAQNCWFWRIFMFLSPFMLSDIHLYSFIHSFIHSSKTFIHKFWIKRGSLIGLVQSNISLLGAVTWLVVGTSICARLSRLRTKNWEKPFTRKNFIKSPSVCWNLSITTSTGGRGEEEMLMAVLSACPFSPRFLVSYGYIRVP